jgi:hypothetical protein
MPDSVLCRHLKASLPELREIHSFQWSGSNLQYKRALAATELLRRHEDLRRRHRHAQHFIVAHSHGGNVALEAALQDKTFRTSLRGIICLSTPFLQFSERTEIDKETLLTLALFGVYFVVLVYLLPLTSWWTRTLLVFLPIGVALWMPKVLDVILGDELDSTSLRALDWGDASPLHRRVWGERPTDLNLLIIRSPGDEASSALGTLQMLGWAATRSLHLAERFLGSLGFLVLERPRFRYLSLGVACIGAAFITLFVCTRLGTSLDSFAPSWMVPDRFSEMMNIMFDWLLHPLSFAARLKPAGVVVSWLMYGFIAACVVTAIVWHAITLFVLILGVFLYVLRLPFGFIQLTKVFTEAITAETCPPGEWTIFQTSLFERTSDLSHSEPYSQPVVLRRISEWIAQITRPIGSV